MNRDQFELKRQLLKPRQPDAAKAAARESFLRRQDAPRPSAGFATLAAMRGRPQLTRMLSYPGCMAR